jgi:rubrerythrin
VTRAAPNMSDPASSRLWLARLTAWLGGHFAFRSQRRTAGLLYGFARTEAQSQLELYRAARICEDVARRALYLRHALDEARHARTFEEHASQVARAAGAQDLPGPSAGSENLFELLGEARFLAFVHLGERRGRTQFEVYARLLHRRGALPLARLFEQLVHDERQHEAYTARLLQEVFGAPEARRALRWAARSAAWRAFRRHGRRLAGAVYTACMLLVYATLAPYALAFRLLSKPRRGFSSDP